MAGKFAVNDLVIELRLQKKQNGYYFLFKNSDRKNVYDFEVSKNSKQNH